VTAVDTDAETVTVRPRDGEPFDQPYDDLLAADGLYAPSGRSRPDCSTTSRPSSSSAPSPAPPG
jgi:hypothetical protein